MKFKNFLNIQTSKILIDRKNGKKNTTNYYSVDITNKYSHYIDYNRNRINNTDKVSVANHCSKLIYPLLWEYIPHILNRTSDCDENSCWHTNMSLWQISEALLQIQYSTLFTGVQQSENMNFPHDCLLSIPYYNINIERLDSILT